MAVTYNQVLKTATIDTKQLTDEAIADTSTSRNGSLAIAQFDAEQIIKLNGGDDGVLMIPFHAIDNVVVEQTTQEVTKEDPFCTSDSERKLTLNIVYTGLCEGDGETASPSLSGSTTLTVSDGSDDLVVAQGEWYIETDYETGEDEIAVRNVVVSIGSDLMDAEWATTLMSIPATDYDNLEGFMEARSTCNEYQRTEDISFN